VVSGAGELRLIVALAVSGLGLGAAAVVATSVGTGSAAPEERGFAAGLVNTATQLGTAVSVALLVAVASAVGDGGDATVEGLRVGFVITAGVTLAGGAAVLALLRGSGVRDLRR
jgi:MFS family permease